MTTRKEGEAGRFERSLTLKAINVEERSIVHVITDSTIDRSQEIVDPNGVDKRNYDKNPVVLFGHNYRAVGDQIPIVGRAAWVKQEGESLIAKTIFSDATQLARDAWALAKEGLMPATSIGFIPRGIEAAMLEDVKDLNPSNRADYDPKAQVFIFRNWELLEYSLVPIPANPNAVERHALAKALDVTESDEVRGMLKAALDEKRICELEGCKEGMEQRMAATVDEVRLLLVDMEKRYEDRLAELAGALEQLTKHAEPPQAKTGGMTGTAITGEAAKAAVRDALAGVISRRRGRV